MAELTRVVNHIWSIGFILNDLGALQTPALYAIEEREMILDLFEEVSGSRMMCNYMRFGGVVRDLPAGWEERTRYIGPRTLAQCAGRAGSHVDAATRSSRRVGAASAISPPKICSPSASAAR